MSEHIPQRKPSGERVKVELGLSNYATKAYLKMQQVLIHQNLLKKLIYLTKNLMYIIQILKN